MEPLQKYYSQKSPVSISIPKSSVIHFVGSHTIEPDCLHRSIFQCPFCASLILFGVGLHVMCIFFVLQRPGRKRDFSPLPWSQYFETIEDVEVENENGKDISLTCVSCREKIQHELLKLVWESIIIIIII